MATVNKTALGATAIRISLWEKDIEIGHGYLYLIDNDRHEQPYGLIEDIFIESEYRKRGLGRQLVEALIQEAKDRNCYKLTVTSRTGRERLHEWYKQLGFTESGLSFRMDLTD